MTHRGTRSVAGAAGTTVGDGAATTAVLSLAPHLSTLNSLCTARSEM